MRALRALGDGKVLALGSHGERLVVPYSETMDAHIAEATSRCARAARAVAEFPLIEHALDLYANGGPDMRGEAQALALLIEDFARRMSG